MANVIFKFGTKAQFNALTAKDSNTLYWLTDVLELWKGDALYAKGTEATQLASGLMSAADKKKLDELVNAPVAEYSIERQAATEGDTVAKYRLKKTVDGEATYVGDTINIPADMIVESGSEGVVTEADKPYPGAQVGDYYLDIVLNDANNTHVYVPAKDLYTPNTAGAGIKIENNVVSVKIDSTNANGMSATERGIALDLATAEKAGAMSAVDKVALDTLGNDMTQVKADIEVLKTTGAAGGILWENI